jgi:leader peptidase (prepilin peptidase) / N-methyltransferase
LIFVGMTLFGLVVGSFLNVVIHRVPLRRLVVWPASRCPRCEKAIEARDNFPLLSYALICGRSTNCGTSISARFPMVGLPSGLLLAAVTDSRALSYHLFLALVPIAVLIALAAIDLEHRLLPNVIVGPAALTRSRSPRSGAPRTDDCTCSPPSPPSPFRLFTQRYRNLLF